jgi:CRISPR-associated endoribonuclease Cas6
MMASGKGELYSFLLRLYPLNAEQVVLITDSQVQAAFLGMVRQFDPALFDWLSSSNLHAPYTVALLQDLDHRMTIPFEKANMHRQKLFVRSGQTYWLSITMLDAAIFGSLVQYLIAMPDRLTMHMGGAQFEVSRLWRTSELDSAAQSLVAYSSFADLCVLHPAQRQYQFECVSPTVLCRGQQSWGRTSQAFPEPHAVFEGLARQWELFAPAHLRMKAYDLSVRTFSLWCEQNVAVAYYAPSTSHHPLGKSSQVGFQGTVVYEVRGRLTAPAARWLSPLARFALFSGVGCKTAIGMGRVCCTNLVEPSLFVVREEVQ